MHAASSFTVTRSTATGSQPVAFVEALGDSERVAVGRVIADLLSALELQGGKLSWPAEYASIRAELLLEEWGLTRLPAKLQVSA